MCAVSNSYRQLRSIGVHTALYAGLNVLHWCVCGVFELFVNTLLVQNRQLAYSIHQPKNMHVHVRQARYYYTQSVNFLYLSIYFTLEAVFKMISALCVSVQGRNALFSSYFHCHMPTNCFVCLLLVSFILSFFFKYLTYFLLIFARQF